MKDILHRLHVGIVAQAKATVAVMTKKASVEPPSRPRLVLSQRRTWSCESSVQSRCSRFSVRRYLFLSSLGETCAYRTIFLSVQKRRYLCSNP